MSVHVHAMRLKFHIKSAARKLPKIWLKSSWANELNETQVLVSWRQNAHSKVFWYVTTMCPTVYIKHIGYDWWQVLSEWLLAWMKDEDRK